MPAMYIDGCIPVCGKIHMFCAGLSHNSYSKSLCNSQASEHCDIQDSILLLLSTSQGRNVYGKGDTVHGYCVSVPQICCQ